MLDVVWKTLWGVLTLFVAVIAVFWFTSDLRSIDWNIAGVRGIHALVAASVLRAFWLGKRADAILTLIAAISVSALLWLALEAFFRRKLVRDVSLDLGRSSQPYTFKIFFASGILKATIVVTTAFVMLGLTLMGAMTLAVVMFLALIFLLTILDTLIRADAVELLGTDLIRVTGLVGILMSFEGMVAVSFVTILLAGALHISEGTGVIAMLAAFAATVVFLSLLHGYLLLVRFSAIAIMRRNVVEI
jgi:hypothetical protein